MVRWNFLYFFSVFFFHLSLTDLKSQTNNISLICKHTRNTQSFLIMKEKKLKAETETTSINNKIFYICPYKTRNHLRFQAIYHTRKYFSAQYLWSWPRETCSFILTDFQFIYLFFFFEQQFLNEVSCFFIKCRKTFSKFSFSFVIFHLILLNSGC